MENQNKNKAEVKRNYTENNMKKNMDEMKRNAFMEGYLYAIQVLQDGLSENEK